MATEIPLNKGLVALVDDADAARVLAVGSWHADPKGKTVYARHGERKNGRMVHVMLHTFLTGWPLTDHRNLDGLDNRRANLRRVTKAQNMRNTSLYRNNTSGYKGVTRKGRRWMARIRVDGSLLYLGAFVDVAEAGRAYDAAALEHFGEFARLNFKVAS